MGLSVLSRRAGALTVVVALQGGARPASALSCEEVRDVVFTYPSAETPSVPPDAIFWAVPTGYSRVIGMSLDGGEPIAARGIDGVDALMFVPASALEPGPHEVEFILQGAFRGLVVIPFEVGAEESEPVARVRSSTRTIYLAAGTDGALTAEEYAEARRLASQPDDCSAIVQLQHFACNYEDIIPPEQYIELEADGDLLGFFVGGSFMPAHCRSAFLRPSTTAYEIYPITPTSVGTPEVVRNLGSALLVAPEAPAGNASEPKQQPSSSSCSVPAGTRTTGGTARAVTLLSLGLLLQRARRRMSSASSAQS